MTGAAADDLPQQLDYETAKALARHMDADVRSALARRVDVRPEILVFLSADHQAPVRAALATNPQTPHLAHEVLASDPDTVVRQAVAARAAQMIPADGTIAVDAAVARILMVLADDAADDVRRTLAEAVQHLSQTPNRVAKRLARDTQLTVAEPMLRNSPALTEDDLLEIATDNPIQGALGAIARRSRVSPQIADAIARADDVDAVTVLLCNRSAQIREDTLDAILDKAPRHTAWHRPLVERPSLPPHAVSRLAEFVATTLVEVLQARPDLTIETQNSLAATLQARAEEIGAAAEAPVEAPAAPVASLDEDPAVVPAQTSPVEAAMARANALNDNGNLDLDQIDEAIFNGDRALVVAGLAVLGRLPYLLVDHILQSQSAKGVVALAWRAGMPMSFAVKLQLTAARIAPGGVLRPGPNDSYPLPDADLAWQLEFFGAKLT